MSKKVKTRLLKYSISGGIALLLAVSYLVSRHIGSLDRVTTYLVLCDAFTIPGLLFLMAGFLMWISCSGGFDGLSYAVKYAVSMLIPGKKSEHLRYGDYVMERRGKRVTGYGFLFVVGGICLALALVFLMLFYSLYQH